MFINFLLKMIFHFQLIRIIPFLLQLSRPCESNMIIFPGTRFYNRFLSTSEDCRSFLESPSSQAGRSLVFINLQSLERFFLDVRFQTSLRTCLFSVENRTRVRYVITEFRGVTSIDEDTWQVYKNLMDSTKSWINITPQFNAILGPGGNNSSVFSITPNNLSKDTWIVVSCSEEEDIEKAYPNDFQAILNKTLLPFAKTSKRMLQLNGWLLANMEGMFNWNGLRSFMITIIHTRNPLNASQVEAKIPRDLRNRIYINYDLGNAAPPAPPTPSTSSSAQIKLQSDLKMTSLVVISYVTFIKYLIN